MTDLQRVSVKTHTLRSYRSYCTAKQWKQIQTLSKQLKGLRVVHINATPVGGGVAELLQTLVPLETNIGLNASWHTIQAPSSFFEITKELHNALQGKRFSLTKADIKEYKRISEEIATALSRIRYDLVIIHDPQPMGAIEFFHQPPMVLRIHPDASAPHPKLLKLFRPYFQSYEHLVFSHASYLPKGILHDQTSVIMPAIDPRRKKNIALSRKAARTILAKIGIDSKRPIAAQVSRFDPWKDPKGVIEAYRIAKKRVPDLQLILMGIRRAKDDPEAVSVLKDIRAFAKNDPDIHLFYDVDQLKGMENDKVVNAVQSGSDVLLQLSIREGFGLTATEAMWKGAALIGGPATGLRMQINHGKNGYIAKNPNSAGKYLIRLLKDDALRISLGKNAKASVRKQFLVPRLLLDHLRLYRKVLGQK